MLVNSKILLLSFAFLSSTIVFAQNPLTADAGLDQAICVEINSGVDSSIIGGQPSATGGVPPYSYSWSFTLMDPSGYETHASHFLNDTTLANPMVVDYSNHYNNDTNFPYLYLTVTDATGATCMASTRITVSTFVVTLGGTVSFYITQGDSVHCFGGDVSGGMGPSTYLWTPNHGLIDSTNYEFWTKPDTTTRYTLTITDSVGCSQSGQEGIVAVTVFPLGIKDGIPNPKISVYPNPASDYIQVERKGQWENETFSMYDMTGKEVLKSPIQSELQQIDVSQLARGSYTFIIGGSTGKIVLR
jgi:hypothetical protein